MERPPKGLCCNHDKYIDHLESRLAEKDNLIADCSKQIAEMKLMKHNCIERIVQLSNQVIDSDSRLDQIAEICNNRPSGLVNGDILAKINNLAKGDK
jgi:uncharacterized coiled-coil protein SlyX